MRQIVLDTETTGLEPAAGHKIIEIGCVELINRKLTGRHFHQYIKPGREIDEGAIEVHGITNEFLEDKPPFSSIVDDFLDFVKGAELVIHNAPFDVGFIDHELRYLQRGLGLITDYCTVLDTLVLARNKHPGQKNNLDALCRRYDIDNSQRDLHGALLDAEILADVYLAMTGGQTRLSLHGEEGQEGGVGSAESLRRVSHRSSKGAIIRATADEIDTHERKLAAIDKISGGQCVWLHSPGTKG